MKIKNLMVFITEITKVENDIVLFRNGMYKVVIFVDIRVWRLTSNDLVNAFMLFIVHSLKNFVFVVHR